MPSFCHPYDEKFPKMAGDLLSHKSTRMALKAFRQVFRLTWSVAKQSTIPAQEKNRSKWINERSSDTVETPEVDALLTEELITRII